ncbi:MAG: hypothetical protein PWR11_694 [Bacillota bacterium]|nr:hypothetical protein [Bacillota bacterium]
MQPGKLAPELLNRLVFPYLGAKRQDVLVRPGIGQDCSVVDLGSELAVLSSDPITASGHHLGYLAVHVAANDLAAIGAEPVGLLLTLLLPPGTFQDKIEAIMQEIHAAAGSLNMAVLGGHTEFTNAVCQPLAAVTALGRAPRGRYITAAGGRPGDTLLLTKTAGCEGTAILASDLADKLEAALGADLGERHARRDRRWSPRGRGRAGYSLQLRRGALGREGAAGAGNCSHLRGARPQSARANREWLAPHCLERSGGGCGSPFGARHPGSTHWPPARPRGRTMAYRPGEAATAHGPAAGRTVPRVYGRINRIVLDGKSPFRT